VQNVSAEIVSRLAGKDCVFPAGKVFPPGTKVDPFATRRCCATSHRPTIEPDEVLAAAIEKSNFARSIPLLSHLFSKHE
jgi:hypothetical protein